MTSEEERMLSQLETEQGIRRVSWIPKKLDAEVETIRKKIGYTRSGFYRYALTRLLEQALLSKPTETYLDPWQEAVGILETVETNNQTTTITISCTKDHKITLPANTPQTTLQQLHKSLGQKVSLIRTDDPNRLVVIRTFSETTVAKNYDCALSWFRSSFLRAALKVATFKSSLWQSGLR